MRILLVILTLFLFSCGGEKPDAETKDSVPQQQSAIEAKAGSRVTVSCRQDVANTYELYLPASFDAAFNYPVLILFSPQGDGKVPCELYKEIADRWNIMLVGSNYTRNGMNGQMVAAGANMLVEDVKGRLPVDPNRIWLCGFSGGSRVAAGVATNRKDISGVIGCSAAPAGLIAPVGFVGITGAGDMNYLEMKKYSEQEVAPGVLHALLVSDEKHEWPSKSWMEAAVLMQLLYHPGFPAAQEDELWADSLLAIADRQSDALSSLGCLLPYTLYSEVEFSASNTQAGKKFTEKKQSWEKKGCVTTDRKAWADAETKEQDLQKFLAEAVLSRDTTWWKNESSKYFETEKKGAEKFMRDRLRGYASLISYTYCNQAFGMNNVHAIEKLVRVYSIVDPANPEWAYMEARLYVMLNLPDLAVNSLRKSAELGFRDRSRAENDPVFAGLKQRADFGQVLAEMQ